MRTMLALRRVPQRIEESKQRLFPHLTKACLRFSFAQSRPSDPPFNNEHFDAVSSLVALRNPSSFLNNCFLKDVKTLYLPEFSYPNTVRWFFAIPLKQLQMTNLQTVKISFPSGELPCLRLGVALSECMSFTTIEVKVEARCRAFEKTSRRHYVKMIWNMLYDIEDEELGTRALEKIVLSVSGKREDTHDLRREMVKHYDCLPKQGRKAAIWQALQEHLQWRPRGK